jgi:hypothetical protein
MPIGTSVYPPIVLTNANAEKITPLTITLSNTEYSHVLQDNLTQLRIKCRSNATLQYAFKNGESATNFWTIPRGCVDNIDGLSFSGKTLYIQSDKTSVIVEIMELYLT